MCVFMLKISVSRTEPSAGVVEGCSFAFLRLGDSDHLAFPMRPPTGGRPGTTDETIMTTSPTEGWFPRWKLTTADRVAPEERLPWPQDPDRRLPARGRHVRIDGAGTDHHGLRSQRRRAVLRHRHAHLLHRGRRPRTVLPRIELRLHRRGDGRLRLCRDRRQRQHFGGARRHHSSRRALCADRPHRPSRSVTAGSRS